MYTKHKWESDRHFNFGYVKYLPKDFDENKKYPLVLFLHGAGEWGDNLEDACRHGFMKHVRESGKEYPFICISPQCPRDKYWACYTESLIAFLDYNLRGRYRRDPAKPAVLRDFRRNVPDRRVQGAKRQLSSTRNISGK